jgi:hypothetical protein
MLDLLRIPGPRRPVKDKTDSGPDTDHGPGPAPDTDHAQAPVEPPWWRRHAAKAWLPVAAGLAWLVPLGAQALGLDAVLPVLVLLGTAGLLRSGRTLLDRLVLAAVTLVGAVSAAGLLFSVWPWGLSPVPVAQAALLALVALAVVTRRAPRLPLPRVSDVLVLIAGAGPAVYLWSTFWGRDAIGRLSLVIGGEDLARHFTVFDAIRHVGGYLPLHRSEVTRLVLPGMEDYPQASHLTAALLDNFVRSSTAPGDGVNAFEHYLGWNLATYGLLGVVLVWSARWVAGRVLRGWRLVAAAAVIGSCLAGGYLVSLIERGYPSETLGLAMLAALVAVTARPLRRTCEQLLVVGSLAVGVCYSYYLYAPLALVVVLVWMVRYRRRLRRHVFWTLGVVPATAALAAFWPMMSLRSGVSATALLPEVGIPEVDRRLLVALGVLILLATLTRAGRRNPVWWSIATTMVAATAGVTAIGVYQLTQAGSTSYYFDKALHAVLVVGFVGIGAIALLLPVDPFGWSGAPGRRRSWVRRAFLGSLSGLTAVASALAAVFAFGLLAPARAITSHPDHKGGVDVPDTGVSRGRAFHTGQLSRPADATAAIRTYERYPDGNDGTVTLVVTAYRLYVPSLFLAAFRRQGGEASGPVTMINGRDKIGTLQNIARQSPLPVRFVVASEDKADALSWLTDHRPELDFTYVVVPRPDAPSPPGA